jgi:hypothetical protein
MRLTPPSLLISGPHVTKWYDAPSTSVHSPRKEGKSGAVRHSNLILPIIFHWKEVGPDRLALVDTSRYKIRSFPTCSSRILYLPTYTTSTQLNQSTKLSTLPPLSSKQTLHFVQSTHNLPLKQKTKKENGTHHTPPPHPSPTPHPLSLHPRPLHRANRRATLLAPPPSKRRESRLGEAIQTRGRCCHVVSFLHIALSYIYDLV